MNILDEARRILEKQGYYLFRTTDDTVQFEDETLMGFVCQAPLKDILGSWSEKQDRFLMHNASLLRKSPLKAWNLYSVFLSPDSTTEAERKQIAKIEEDFRATRKLVQTGIIAPADVVRALYQFIPIQNVVSLGAADSIRTLRERLVGFPPRAVDALLDEEGGEEQALKAFQTAHDIEGN